MLRRQTCVEESGVGSEGRRVLRWQVCVEEADVC